MFIFDSHNYYPESLKYITLHDILIVHIFAEEITVNNGTSCTETYGEQRRKFSKKIKMTTMFQFSLNSYGFFICIITVQ